ncbi:DUF808 domain-containing protein [Avrilella dinanensis]|uniref:DUF808 domain-containing protein n=1 Tax=Avrilella dinanensis TaxID=2008672 RepID=A0A2M9R655_9FLAO|nr:DUF808 domain-containing protein [Avrilella dinanensis]PJR04349.1 hypothetical protein CDL10_07225 [Avrilella dinanensis]
MASGFFAILDDIAMLMDDVALASKVATKKTAGILGDDLAVNAEKATGFSASRELPVLWAITKGSFVNKLIILPVIFLLNYYLPDLIKYVLIAGGLYLAYEGVEKIIWYFFHRKHEQKHHEETTSTEPLTVVSEKEKIKSAIITDFILSVEIVIIALSTVADADLSVQIVTVSVVAILATIGVYGLVALIVRMDDFGLKLVEKSNNTGLIAKTGNVLIKLLPVVIKALGVIGTVALLLVSGEIFSHQVDYFHHLLNNLPAIARQIIFALVMGTIAFLIVSLIKKTIGLVSKKEA